MNRSLVVPILAAAVLLGLAEPSTVVATPPAAPVLIAGDIPDGADITAVSVLIDPTDDVLAALEIGETAPQAFSPTVTTTVVRHALRGARRSDDDPAHLPEVRRADLRHGDGGP